jgi:hypothetical protein
VPWRKTSSSQGGSSHSTTSPTTARWSSSSRRVAKLPAAERDPLYRACDRHLERIVAILEPEWVVGIGRFAQRRARDVLGEAVRVGSILHPSPANPRAHANWGATARSELERQGVCGRLPGTRARRHRDTRER